MELKTLTEMGIQHPEEITHYDFRQKTKKKDELIVYFEREKGSLRAASRAYLFGRSLNTVVTDSGSPTFEDTYEVSPFALAAMDELNHILSITRPSLSTLKQMMMRDLEALADLTAGDDTGDGAKVKEALERLRERVGMLH